MKKEVMTALWGKIKTVFATKAQLAAAFAGKQDVLTAGTGISIRENVVSVIEATDERVTIAVTSAVEGVDVEGLTIEVYYNGASRPATELTTDENGMAVLRVPNGYHYRLVFPVVAGCDTPAAVEHTSALSERSVEVEYKAEGSTPTELVRVLVRRRRKTSLTPEVVSGARVAIETGGETTVLTADADGVAELSIPWGRLYTVSLPDTEEGFVATSPQTLESGRKIRAVTMTYRYATSDLIIITTDGTEYTEDEFRAAVVAGVHEPGDAQLIAVVTDVLVNAGGAFAVDVDNFGVGMKQWAASNVQFNSVPLNGNAATALYYYDGLTASRRIQAEGDERNIGTPAVDACLELSVTTGETTHQGFLGSTGQWAQLWANIGAFDSIMDYVRPLGSRLAVHTEQKWTCTQINAGYAYYWGAAALNVKDGSYVVLPFFAY